MPDLLLYINSLLWRFVHFSSGPDARVRDGGMARVCRDDRPRRREKCADGVG
jgi:hypothetical protein